MFVSQTVSHSAHCSNGFACANRNRNACYAHQLFALGIVLTTFYAVVINEKSFFEMKKIA